MIEKLVCTKDKTVYEVMKTINQNERGCVFIVDQMERLCDVLTDGDIRRILLDGHGLHEKIEPLLKGRFEYAHVGETERQLLARINKTIRILPIVDHNFKVVDYFEFQNSLYVPVASPDLKGNELKYLTDAFLSTWISSAGEYVDRFEKGFADFCNTSEAVAVSNGTAALHLALLALGIGEGDEVIVPDLTFAATINAVLYVNATPVIVDVEEDSWCINPCQISKAITPRTKAIIPVHLFGQPCDMLNIMYIARQNGLYVIEDCAQAHGAVFADMKVGSIGDVGCFSFFGNKVITCGEGGMCTTNSPEIAEKIRVFRDHGMSKDKRYWHDTIGYNYRLTNLQASIGLAQLERIDSILEQRAKVETMYRRSLKNCSNISFQEFFKNRDKITWLVSCLVDGDREDYIKSLAAVGIDCRPFFYSLSTMPLYAEYCHSNEVSKRVSEKGIMFPTGNNVNRHSIERVEKVFRQFAGDYSVGIMGAVNV